MKAHLEPNMHVTKKRKTGPGEQAIAERVDDNTAPHGGSDSESEAESGDEMSVDEKEKNGGPEKKTKVPQKRNSAAVPLEKLNEGFESKSSYFQMETEELLKQTKVNYEGKLSTVVKMVHRIREIIEKIPERKPAPVCKYIYNLARSLIYVRSRRPRNNSQGRQKSLFLSPIQNHQVMRSTSSDTRNQHT